MIRTAARDRIFKGLLLAAALRVFFTVSLLWGLVIFEGIAALAAVILKIVDNKT